MPYRARGMTVEKQEESGDWITEKRHTSAAKAKAHASALNKNTGHSGKEEESYHNKKGKKGSYH